MKAYKTKEINEKLDNPSWDDNTLIFLDKERLKNWMIKKNHREEVKPLNTWYKYNDGSIFYFTETNKAFGFNTVLGSWSIAAGFRLSDELWQPCPKKEWKSMLIQEAKNTGFKNGNYNCLDAPNATVCALGVFTVDSGDVWYGTQSNANKVFDGQTGEWAKIIPSIPEYTMEEAIKIVGHQFKIKQ